MSFLQSFFRRFDRAEGLVASLALVVIALLLPAEMVARFFDTSVPGALPLVRHLTLWVAFLGAALAASEGKLLALATGTFLPAGRWRDSAQVFAALVAAAVTVLLLRASVEFLLVEKEFGDTVALKLPVWVTLLVLPISFALIALRIVWRASPRWGGRAVAASGIAIGLWLGQRPELLECRAVWPALAVILAAMLLGAPIFTVLGGAAVLLFMADGVPIAAVPVETYRLAVSPTLPAIPLFTLAGFLLAEGKSSQRLVGVFRAFFGWAPGGTAIVTALVCAFFTIFTGGSGVTILALGGLLFKALQADHYREQFSLGLLTASGSLGLLLPPALPLILYGIVAEVPIPDLFIGGIIPGLLLIGLIAAWGVREGLITGAGRAAFDRRTAASALWLAKWELMLPVFLLVAILGGFATVVEASALAALYALVVQRFVHHDLTLRGICRGCCATAWCWWAAC